ncbi:MAG: isoamylase early set domain-containing protein [Bacteroidota bacterium]
MIRKKKVSDDTTEVTFILPAPIEGQIVSVVGDFNDWQPDALHFKASTDNTFAATTTLPAGQQYIFRYLTEHGRWFDEDAADGFQPNDYGSGNCLLYT